MLRVLVFAICCGACATEVDGLPIEGKPSAVVDAGVEARGYDVGVTVDMRRGPTRNLDLDTRDNSTADCVDGSRSIVDVQVSGEASMVDVQGGEVGQASCVQRVIDNGYANCAPRDLYYVACSTCAGGDDRVIVDRCETAIDCLARNAVCDQACLEKCIGIPYDAAVFVCVRRIVTSVCGAQPWSAGAWNGCEKAP